MTIFDDTKFDHTTMNNDYKVKYSVFNSEERPEKITSSMVPKFKNVEHTHEACFSSLRSIRARVKNANRLFFHCDLKFRKEKGLSGEDAEWWVRLWQKEEVLPAVNSDVFKSRGVCVDIKDVSPIHLYLRLCLLRDMQEVPWFVRTMRYMIEELGMGTFTALTPSSMFSVTGTGHHFLPISRSYSFTWDKYKKEKKPFDLTLSSKLFTVVRMSREELNDKTKDYYDQFPLSPLLRTTVAKSLVVNEKKLLDPKTEELVRSK